jgi:hypothetical protein
MKAPPPSDSAKSLAYPKSQAAYSIYDGRFKAGSPRATVAPPVQLFNPAFGHFLDDIRKHPDDAIVRTTIAYMREASAVYTTEEKRRQKLTPLLSTVLGVHIQMVLNSDKTCPDGIVEFLTPIGAAAVMHMEDKNEKGDGGSDASTQVSLSHPRCFGQDKVFLSIPPSFVT